MDDPVGEIDFKILEAMSGSPGQSSERLAELLGLKKPEMRKRIRSLIKYGLVTPSPGKKDAFDLTGRGRFLLEKRDPKIATGYSPMESVPDHSAFKFALGDGIMTGDVAHSYREFLDVIKRIDSRSLVFHVYRGDFDSWVSEVFRDRRLSAKLARLKSRTRPVDQLRSKVIRILEDRLEELERG
jgi:DNA-binding MarR family transcriptional regulator